MSGASGGTDPDIDPQPPRRRPAWRGRTLLLIAAGGALGSVVRDRLGVAFPTPQGQWPWTIFWVNVTGAFVLGALLETLAVLGPDEGWRRRARLGVGTGVLGGYTTYSTFAVDTASLGRSDHLVLALGYALASIVLGFAAAYVATWAVGAAHRRVVLRRMEAAR